jgi:hypothetical protein
VPACLPACQYQLSLNTIATAGLEKKIWLVIWIDFLPAVKVWSNESLTVTVTPVTPVKKKTLPAYFNSYFI